MYIKIIVLIIVFLATYFDLKTYCIPNKLNAMGIVVGLSYSTFMYGINGFFLSLLGMVIPFFLLFVLFGIRVVGAGDIKLLCAIGSFVYQGVMLVIILSFLVAAIMGGFIIGLKMINKSKKLFEYTRMHLSIPIGVATTIFMFIGG